MQVNRVREQNVDSHQHKVGTVKNQPPSCLTSIKVTNVSKYFQTHRE